MQQVLLDVGAWLNVNGEASYGTRPWRTYGEGPTKVTAGSFHDTDVAANFVGVDDCSRFVLGHHEGPRSEHGH